MALEAGVGEMFTVLGVDVSTVLGYGGILLLTIAAAFVTLGVVKLILLKTGW